MRRAAALLAVALAFAAPARAQSPALLEAWERTAEEYRAGRYPAASEWAGRAVALAEREFAPDDPRIAIGLTNLAVLLGAQGKHAEAEPIQRRVLALRETAFGAEHPAVAAALNNLASTLAELARTDEAEAMYRRALAIREAALGPEAPDVAVSLNNLGALLASTGRPAAAEPLYRRSLAIREATLPDDDPSRATALNNLASLLEQLGRWDESEVLQRRSLAILERAWGAEHPDIATSLNNLAYLLDSLARYDESEAFYRRALSVREAALEPGHPLVAGSLGNLAALLETRGRLDEAVALHRRALAIAEAAFGPDHPAVAIALNNLAVALDSRGEDADSEALYRRGLALRRATLGNHHPETAISMNNLATLLVARGRNDEAEALYREGLAVREAVYGADHPDVATALANLAALLAETKRPAEAEALQRRALATRERSFGAAHPAVANSLDPLARLLAETGRLAEAEEAGRRALALREAALGADHPAVATSLARLAMLRRDQGDPRDALALARRAAIITAARGAAASGGRGGRSEQRARRGIFLLQLDLAAASAEAERESEAFAALQRARATDTAAVLARTTARLAAGDADAAATARAREDALHALETAERALVLAAGRPPEDRRPAAEAALREEAGATAKRLAALDLELQRRFPAYAELANPPPLELAAAQALLRPGEALVAFAVAAAHTHVLAFDRDAIQVHRAAIGAAALADAVSALRRGVDPTGKATLADWPDFDAATAHRLHALLLAPLDAILAPATHLIVVPDGALESLPPALLLTEAPSAPSIAPDDSAALRALPWLAQRHAISILPSISSLAALRRAPPQAGDRLAFLGIGDPLLRGHPGAGMTVASAATRGFAITPRGATPGAVWQRDAIDAEALRALDALPETADELAAMAHALGAGDDALLLRADATETAVKRAQLAHHRVIAFATHGLVAGEIGAGEPGLVLTPPAVATAEDDGVLTASEIAALRLDADWVILSACNTAASDGTPGAEGLSGLAKAFVHAGARTLFVSHWPVSSQATVALTSVLLGEASRAGVGRAEAHRRAMQAVRDDPATPLFAHPVFWAPFVVIGEGG